MQCAAANSAGCTQPCSAHLPPSASHVGCYKPLHQQVSACDPGLTSFLTCLAASFYVRLIVLLQLFLQFVSFSISLLLELLFSPTIWVRWSCKRAVGIPSFFFLLLYFTFFHPIRDGFLSLFIVCIFTLAFSSFKYQQLFNYCFMFTICGLVLLILFFFSIPLSLSSCLKFSVNCGFKLCKNHWVPWLISFKEAKIIWKFKFSFQELLILLENVDQRSKW